MSVANEILSRALELPDTERAALAHRLLLSLEPEDFDPDSESAWVKEIDSRLERIDRGEYSASDWRDAVARIRQSLSPGITSSAESLSGLAADSLRARP